MPPRHGAPSIGGTQGYPKAPTNIRFHGRFPAQSGKNPLFQRFFAPGAPGGAQCPPDMGPVDRGHPRLPHGTDSWGVHPAVRPPYTRDGAVSF